MDSGTRFGFTVAAIILVVLLMLGAIAFMLWHLFLAPSGPTEPPQEAKPVEQLEVVSVKTAPPLKTESSPSEPKTEAATQEPEDAQEEEHLYGTLRLAYDKRKLESASEDPKTRVALLLKDGSKLPRLDAQVLDGTALGDSERQRLAVGLLQAYYTDPPATGDVEITADPAIENAYLLRAPVVGDTPEMAARVRFLPAGAKLWYVVLLYPAAQEPDGALLDAWEGAHID